MFSRYMYTFLALQELISVDHNFRPVSLPHAILSQYLILEFAHDLFVQITVQNNLVFFDPGFHYLL